MRYTPKKSSGFTLIELAIALVIIGLIVGGVFISGGATIGSSKVGKTLSIIQDLQQAVIEFKTRYKSLPGDMLVTGQLADVAADCRSGGAKVGDDNGQIIANEADCVIEHLYRAGLIRSDGDDASGLKKLDTPYGGRITLIAPRIIASTWPHRNVTSVIRLQNLPCEVAKEIDSKTDDVSLNAGMTQAYADDGTSISNDDCVDGALLQNLFVAI